jgi:2-polyprenyl-3-methyl-5-hydroxy-6-metoxy-1,4-benzoquinol methylase
MQMEISMKANGKTTKHMAMVPTSMQMVQHTWANGKMINNMVEELKHGQMVLSTKDNMQKVKSMVRALLHLLMVVYIKATSSIMRFRAKGDTYGQTASPMTASGTRIKCMALGCYYGKMVKSTRDIL